MARKERFCNASMRKIHVANTLFCIAKDRVNWIPVKSVKAVDLPASGPPVALRAT
jgi:hypothetical protein